jgi:hypothetical protein
MLNRAPYPNPYLIVRQIESIENPRRDLKFISAYLVAYLQQLKGLA